MFYVFLLQTRYENENKQQFIQINKLLLNYLIITYHVSFHNVKPGFGQIIKLYFTIKCKTPAEYSPRLKFFGV